MLGERKMKLFRLLFIAFAAMASCCPLATVLADSPSLDSNEAETLAFLREFSKYKWDIYRTSGGQMGPIPEEPILLALAADERRRMDQLKKMLDDYGIEDPVVSYELWNFSDGFLTEDLNNRLYVGFGTRNWHFQNCAYLEEMSIRDLSRAISETDESPLLQTYADMLEDAYSTLVVLAAWLHDEPARYTAQLLDQNVVDLIIAGVAPVPIGDFFVINPGLNDAWYEPTTNGQGFFLAVYPERSTVFLGWFTFDVNSPGQDAISALGDPCQRWLVAQGTYEGSRADLVVYNAKGGLFDTALPQPEVEPIGSIVLQFVDCRTGIVSYDLPGLGLSGIIPIQRLASDNVAVCEAQAWVSP